MAVPRTGAYGFRLDFHGDGAPTADLVELGDEAPTVAVSWRLAASISDREQVTPDLVCYATRTGSSIEVRRDPPSIHLDLFEEPPREALVHPILTIPISMLARWRDDMTVHAGAFEFAGGAWAVVGRREAGKSTMLAALATRGLPVIADDLLTAEHGEVWAGPRCVDLRPDAAPRFPAARLMGVVAGRPRFRLSTPPGRTRLPLRGFFLLEWSDEPEPQVTPMAAREVLGLVWEQEYIALMGPPDPRSILEFAARPAWRVRRPRAWEATGATIERMLEAAQS